MDKNFYVKIRGTANMYGDILFHGDVKGKSKEEIKQKIKEDIWSFLDNNDLELEVEDYEITDYFDLDKEANMSIEEVNE